MSVAEMPQGQASYPGNARVRELLRRCARTRDRAERAALLARVAYELDRAADQKAATSPDLDASARELIAGLHGQASMARFIADLERSDRARQATRSASR